jgi:hypothetical protein
VTGTTLAQPDLLELQWIRITALCQLLAVVSSIVMEWDYAGILGLEASAHNLAKLIDAMGPWEVKTYPAVGKVTLVYILRIQLNE